MKLHSGEHVWPRTIGPVPDYPALGQDISCDCLIIGGGISGALCAHLLTDLGMNIVLAEKNEIGSGSTLANTGILQYANDKTLTSFIHTFGEETAVHFYRLCRDALVRLKELGGKLHPDLLPKERSSLYMASTAEDVSMLREEYENLKKYGFQVDWWNEEDFSGRFPFRRLGAIYTQGDAEINPFALVHELLKKATTKGLQIYEHTPITGWIFHSDGVSCRSGQRVIRAKHVIVATGYETQLLKREPGAYLTSTYAVVTEPANHFKDWHERCLIWETARPYLYMRTTPDGRIMAGGLDEPLTGNVLKEGREIKKGQELLELIHNMFPEKSGLRAAYSWGAVFGETRDGLPYIGTHPDYPHCFFLEGYGGNGTVCSMLAAEMITDVLAGKPRSDMELFALTRSTKPAP
ncbi:FAD-dependent oxidoreductase [Paenibacillus sp. Marseille-P2973]|uniref:NAD(P)/FAD-dependent oxidoreductase n=1 Tax=Paenibacillus sp. Marseille-P2973 TaxID=1871032 RepID=UPI001B36C94F|nr:FAD-dependent oxidoreductase [Paenibacillus sp. Marseille-P2973]MBQ4899541.1 FAD-dependent oxidoreductase [Paenibacillus sp. Marseille-P2973]